jgi:hypothetical protein
MLGGMGELIHLDALDSSEFNAPRCPHCGTVVTEPGELCAGCRVRDVG